MSAGAVCLGEVMVDVVAQLPGELAVGSDTPASISLTGGGSAANTAAWLVAAGVPTTFVGRIGGDPLGQTAINDLAALGINLEVSVDRSRRTGVCIVLVGPDGERTMIPSNGANGALSDAPLPEHVFTSDTAVHLSAYALFAPGSRAAVDGAVTLGVARGCPISVDAASAAPLRAFGADAFLAWLPRCLLFANTDEAAVLTGTQDPHAAALVLGARCGEAIVKCGAHGGVWSDGRATVLEVPPATDMVDSTGAGDAFAAGVLAARLTGPADARAWLRAGNVLAARAIAAVGARPPRTR